MSRLDNIIKELCSDGVKYVCIGDVVNYEQPARYIVKSTDYNDKFNIPVLTAGQSFILGYTDEKSGIYNASKENPVIIFDDFTGAFKWVDFSFKVKSSAMKFLIVKKESAILRYIFYIMGNINFSSEEHKRLWISLYSQFKIPLPPIEVQEKIVKILDRYSKSIEELKKILERELILRKKQYKYYRDKLFTFDKNVSFQWTDNAVWRTLGEIAENLDFKRKPVAKGKRVSGIYPYYGASGIVDYVDDYLFDGDYLLVSEDGANLLARSTPIAFSISGKNWVNNHAHVLKFETYVTRRFVEIYLNSINLEKFISTAAQPKLTKNNLNKIPVPVPTFEEQQKIVSILDRFDKLCNNLTKGIPAEIEKRQKQYEYYRDKLLTFKEVTP